MPKARSVYKKKRAKVFYTKGMTSRGAQAAPTPSSSSSSAPTPSIPPSTTPAPTSTPASSSTQVPTPVSTSAPTPRRPILTTTQSGKKITQAREAAAASQPGPSSMPQPEPDNTGDYHLIKMSSLMKAVSAFSCCGSPLSVSENRSSRRGLVVKIAICCSVCGKKSVLTDPYSDEDLEVNQRSVLAARAIGKGRQGLATFTGMMGMLPPVASQHYTVYNDKIGAALSVEREVNTSAAAAQLRKDAADDEIVDVRVTCDATWQKRGHTSLYGVVVVASWDTGQVLDTEVLSKWCDECSQHRHIDPTSVEFLDWWEGHQAWCEANYTGSSGAMEAAGALKIWKRSVEKFKLRYTAMIADGDSSTYPTVAAAEPYGKDHPIVKHECVGHVQKRMYNHLKAAKAKRHVNNDGTVIKMGGKGRLTDTLMKQFQKYYGKAIRSNTGDAAAMANAVMAIFYHSISTDTHPLHFRCPPGETSWCKYKRAEAKGEPPPSRKPAFHLDIAPIVKRVFLDLSSPALMERCVLGATQNQNECFNSLIWNRCPKTSFSSVVIVKIAVDFAVITFNSGQGALRGLLRRLGYNESPTLMKFLDSKDELRAWQAEYKGKELIKKRRRQMRLDRVAVEEANTAAEGGPSYVPGGF